MNNCKTCKKEIPDIGKTGRPMVFCSDKCKQYHTNFIKNEIMLDSMISDSAYCGFDEEKLREWATEYGVDAKGAFRRKIFEPLFGVATGLSNTTHHIMKLVDEHPGNHRLTKDSERFNAWRLKSSPKICPVCEEKWPSFNQTIWRIYCSENCCNTAKRSGGSVRTNIDKIMVEKYGVKGGFTKERVESFNDEREAKTGFRHATQRPEVKQKILESMCNAGRFISNPEKEISEYFQSKYALKVENSVSNLVRGKQIDIYFPERGLAVEYNGCFFHSEGNGGREFAKRRHVDKTNACEELGVQLVHIWEDEWVSDKPKVLGLLEAKLGLLKPSLYARNCNVVRNPDAHKLLSETHIQGYARSSFSYGLEHDGELVAVMCFLNTQKSGVFELNRFASRGVHGSFSKLLSVFKDENKWDEVYSFGDRCVVSRLGNVYSKNGFEEISVSPPDYKYTSGKCDRIHKFNFRKKTLLRKHSDILNHLMTESEMAEILGFKRIYNSGLIRYSIKNH